MQEKDVGKISQTTESFVEQNKDLFLTMASCPVTIVSSKEGDFHLNPKKREISLGYTDEWGYKNNVFAGAHELGHVADLVNDSDVFLGQFEHIKTQAKKMAPEFIDILKANGKYSSFWESVVPGENPDGLSYMEVFLQRKIHQLFNCYDDVVVNRRVGQTFEWLNDKKVIDDLYTKFLFGKDKDGNPNFDMSEGVPLSDQFCSSVLLSQMAPGKYKFSDEIDKVMSTPRGSLSSLLGVDLTREISDRTSPAFNTRNGLLARYKWVNEFLEPILLDFLKKDILRDTPDQDQVSKILNSSSGKESNSNSDKIEDESKNGSKESDTDSQETRDKNKSKDGKLNWSPSRVSSPINEQTARDFSKVINEEKEKQHRQIKEDKLSDPEKEKRAREKVDDDVCRKIGIDPVMAREYRYILSKIPPEVKEKLADVFETFMKTIQEQIKSFYLKNFKSGRLNIDSFIEKYAGYINDPELVGEIPWQDLDIYNQKELLSRLALQPSEIYFHLVLDGSGSMNPDRINAVRSLAVLFLESLGTFESRVNTRFRLKKPFMVNTEISLFSNKVDILKSFNSGSNPNSELGSRFLAVEGIKNKGGNTYDDSPLLKIKENLSDKRKEEISLKKVMEMVVLITDGGSSNEVKTKEVVKGLKKQGLITKGLQIGDPNSTEKDIFNGIWGSDGAEVKSLDQLPKVFAGLVSDFIKSMVPQIQFYEIDEEE
jgi:hypothetical protein